MRLLPLARALLAMAAAHLCAWGQGRIAVAVFNQAGAPAAVVSEAVDTARRALRTAQIESNWTICTGDSCRPERPAGEYLAFFIMPRLRVPLADHPRIHPAGFAMLAGFDHPRAYALYDAVTIASERTLKPLSEVLGCTLVHELGHLLGLGHQPHGAMRANLEGEDIDRTVMGQAFTVEEKRKLRAAVR